MLRVAYFGQHRRQVLACFDAQWPDLKITVAQSNFCGREPIPHSSIVVVGRSQEDRQMWLYVQTWLPLLSISFTAAICFGVASFVMGQAKPRTHTHPF